MMCFHKKSSVYKKNSGSRTYINKDLCSILYVNYLQLRVKYGIVLIEISANSENHKTTK